MNLTGFPTAFDIVTAARLPMTRSGRAAVLSWHGRKSSAVLLKSQKEGMIPLAVEALVFRPSSSHFEWERQSLHDNPFAGRSNRWACGSMSAQRAWLEKP